MERENTVLKEAHILLHPLRYRIASLLAERPLNLQELIETLCEDRRLISYHLLILEEHGFVSGKFKFSRSDQMESREAGVAYGVTEKGRISYQFLILEAEGVVGDKTRHPLPLVMKGRVAREYQTTDKVEGVLSELKRIL
ncbi:MAG: helix-turn-helix transcriptional regulator [Methanomicrobia archaeon]|nr:helix-turn-helix transcriptional regulator [Methanomicrobia archaeon]